MNTNNTAQNMKYDEYLVTCPGHLCQVLNPGLMQLCLFLKAQAAKRSAKKHHVSLFSVFDISTYLIYHILGDLKTFIGCYILRISNSFV